MTISNIGTQYRSLTTEEFLSQIEEKRQYSPIIQELCLRLEYKETHGNAQTNPRIECPVCESQLKIAWDSENNLYDVEIDKD